MAYTHSLAGSIRTGYVVGYKGVGKTTLLKLLAKAIENTTSVTTGLDPKTLVQSFNSILRDAEQQKHGRSGWNTYVRVGSYAGGPAIRIRACEEVRRTLLNEVRRQAVLVNLWPNIYI